MGATDIYALPYPEAADPTDAPAQFRALAEDTETVLQANDTAVDAVDARVTTVDNRVTSLDASTDSRLDAHDTTLTGHTNSLSSLTSRVAALEARPTGGGGMGVVLPAPTGRWFPFPAGGGIGGYNTASLMTGSSGQAFYHPFRLAADVTVDALAVAIAQGSAGLVTFKWGFYNTDQGSGMPTTLKLDIATHPWASNGVKTFTFAPTLLTAGMWTILTVIQGSNQGAVQGMGNSFIGTHFRPTTPPDVGLFSGGGSLQAAAAITGALPGTANPGTTYWGNTPWYFLRAA